MVEPPPGKPQVPKTATPGPRLSIPTGHRRAYIRARAELQHQSNRLPGLLLHLARYEPGRNPRPGGDGAAGFLRRAGDFEFDLDGTASGGFLLHTHDGSLGSGCCGRGWATTIRRCARPPGADSLWYFETSFVMAAASSAGNAARSAGDRKRTPGSTARAARRLPAFFARPTRSDTSRTIRAPRAMR